MWRIILFLILVGGAELAAQPPLRRRYFNIRTENGKYGFVNEYNKPILGGYIYDKAEAIAYSDLGQIYAKVYKNGQKYLLDTLGRTYILADSISEITAETEAAILKSKGLTEWPQTLKKAKRLKILDMPYNKLSVIDVEILGGLKQLELLNLRSCDIDELEPNTFKNLKHLKALDLSGNSISELPDNVFNGLKRLKYLHYPSGIEEIEPAQFKHLHGLKKLSISSVGTIPEGAFRHLKRLKELTLYNVEEVAPYAFSGLTGLDVLDIGQIAELPAGLLAGLPKLRRFDVYDIEAPLPEDFFIGGERLKELYLGYVGDLEETSFLGLDGLEALEIEGDDIWVLDTGFFANLPSLKALRMWEPIIKKAGCFKELDKLEYLEIRPALPEGDEEIGTLPNGVFEGLKGLEYLALYDFDEIKGIIFEDIAQLRVLLLDDCGDANANMFRSLDKLEYLFVRAQDFRKEEEERLIMRWPRCRIIRDNSIYIEDVYIFPLD